MKIHQWLLLLVFLFVIPLVSSQVQTLGTYKVGDCVNLIQLCDNCTYNNITSITSNPEGGILIKGEFWMERNGTHYNYTFCGNGYAGQYVVNGHGDENGLDTVWAYDYYVTPSGYRNILGLFIIMIGVVYGIGLFGFFGRNVWVSIIGGMLMMTLGLFTLMNGVDIYRNFMTESFSYFTIGLGAFFAIYAGLDLIDENL